MYYRIEVYLKEILNEFFNAYDLLNGITPPEVGSTFKIFRLKKTMRDCKTIIPILFHAYYKINPLNEDLSISIREICFSLENLKSSKSKKQIELNLKELERLSLLWKKQNEI